MDVTVVGDLTELLHVANFRKQLSRELAARGAIVCDVDDQARTHLFVKVVDGPAVRLVLESAYEDLLGERTVELAEVPPDARPLAIAVAADELVAESWASLQPEKRSKNAAKTPALWDESQQPTPAGPKGPSAEVGPLFAFESFGGGEQLLGADAAAALFVTPRLALTLRAGVRQGLPAQAPHGSVRARAAGAQAGARLTLFSGERLRVAWFARASASALSVSAYATDGATAFERSAWFSVWTTGAELKLGLSRSLGLVLEGGVGSALRPVRFTDTGAAVSGISGEAGTLGGGVYASF